MDFVKALLVIFLNSFRAEVFTTKTDTGLFSSGFFSPWFTTASGRQWHRND